MTQKHTQSDQEGNERSRVRQAVLVPLDWGGRLVAVRVNDAAPQWAHRDVLEVVSGGREASRKMAEAIAARVNAAGLVP